MSFVGKRNYHLLSKASSSRSLIRPSILFRRSKFDDGFTNQKRPCSSNSKIVIIITQRKRPESCKISFYRLRYRYRKKRDPRNDFFIFNFCGRQKKKKTPTTSYSPISWLRQRFQLKEVKNKSMVYTKSFGSRNSKLNHKGQYIERDGSFALPIA